MAIKRKMSDGWLFEDDTMYDNFNVYNDREVFKINDDAFKKSIDTHFIGKHKTPVIVVDDFLENPDLALKLSQQAVYSNDEVKMHASPGIRSIFKVVWPINGIVKRFFNDWYRDTLNIEYPFPEASTTFTVIDSAEPLSPPQCFPHIDVDYTNGQELGKPGTQLIAILIYLNKDCKGGTGIYRHKKLNKHIITNTDDYGVYKKFQDKLEKDNPKVDNINNEDNEGYELVQKIDMKYNRLVMYPVCLFHHPIYSKDDFKTPNCRIVLGSFV